MLGKLAPGDVVTVTRIDRLWITVTVYSTSHGSCAGRAVSGSTRGFGPGLRGAKGRSSRRSSIALHSGLPSGRPMAGTRSIRVVAAASAGIAKRAAKLEISARNRATVVNSSSSPASCRPSVQP